MLRPRVAEVFSWLHETYRMRRQGEVTTERIPPVDGERLHGYVQEWTGHYRIVLEDRDPLNVQLDTLMHEFAHLKARTRADSPHPVRFYEWQHRIERDFWAWKATQERGDATQ